MLLRTILLTSVLALAAAPGHAPSAPRELREDFEATPSDSTLNAPWHRGGNQPAARVRVVTPGHASAHALRLSAPAGRSEVSFLCTLPESLRAGTSAIRISAWLRTENAGGAGLRVTTIAMHPAYEPFDWHAFELHGTNGWTRRELLVPIAPEVEAVICGVTLTNGGSVWLDDVTLEALTGAQLPPSSPQAVAFLSAGLDSICQRNAFTSELAWGVLRRAANTQMIAGRTPADAHAALRYAMRRIDAWSQLRTAAWRDSALRASREHEGILPSVGPLEPGVAYVRVPACTTVSPSRQLEYADSLRAGLVRAFAHGTRGWIVDLRQLGESELAPALLGLGPLLGDGRVLGWNRPNGTRGDWTLQHDELRGGPAGPAADLSRAISGPAFGAAAPPVALLIDRSTSGAGEAIAAAFRGRAGARSFGQRTAGRCLLREEIRLSDGTGLYLATGRIFDRSGAVVTEALVPDVLVGLGDSPASYDSVRTAARDWLGAAAR